MKSLIYPATAVNQLEFIQLKQSRLASAAARNDAAFVLIWEISATPSSV
jgi:hypothetical protein